MMEMDLCALSAVSNANLGLWCLIISQNIIVWNDRMYELYSVDPNTIPNYETFISRVAEEDVVYVNTAVNHTLKTKEPYKCAFKLRSGKFVLGHGGVTEAASGEVLFSGLNMELTEDEYNSMKYSMNPGKDPVLVSHDHIRKSVFNGFRKWTNRVDNSEYALKSKEWEPIYEFDNDFMGETPYLRRRLSSPESRREIIIETICPPNSKYKTHYHKMDEIIMNISPTVVDVWIEGELYLLKRGQSVMIPAKYMHRFECSQKSHFIQTWLDTKEEDVVKYTLSELC